MFKQPHIIQPRSYNDVLIAYCMISSQNRRLRQHWSPSTRSWGLVRCRQGWAGAKRARRARRVRVVHYQQSNNYSTSRTACTGSRRLTGNLFAPVTPTPTTFSAGCANHLRMMVFASTAWPSRICWWQTRAQTGTQRAMSGSWPCQCRAGRRPEGELELLRGLCSSPLMPEMIAQTRSRTWQPQLWRARSGDLRGDCALLQLGCLRTVSYWYILEQLWNILCLYRQYCLTVHENRMWTSILFLCNRGYIVTVLTPYYCIDTILVYIGTNKGFTFLRTYRGISRHIGAYRYYCIDTILVYIGTNKGFTFLRTYRGISRHIGAYRGISSIFGPFLSYRIRVNFGTRGPAEAPHIDKNVHIILFSFCLISLVYRLYIITYC